jgi:hypothetical protein
MKQQRFQLIAIAALLATAAQKAVSVMPNLGGASGNRASLRGC